MEDQRRRTLEALERRFAQHKSKKRPAEDKKTFFVSLPVNKPLSISSSKKGSSFSMIMFFIFLFEVPCRTITCWGD